MKNSDKYIGYKQADRQTPYAKYFKSEMNELPAKVAEGLKSSPFASGRLPPFDEVRKMAENDYAEVETGYCVETDGSIRVAILTEMPRVSPEMWDWWFGWHGCADNRYKLWHPQAHRAAQWADGGDAVEYVGRTSVIEEFIGKNLEFASIRFVAPSELGFEEKTSADKSKSVFICARVGYTKLPIDFGWLVHQVRATAGGAEMRSRFWFGGTHIAVRQDGRMAGSVSNLLQKLVRVSEQRAKDLLVHCAEEMNHLAAFLPEIYAEFK